MAFPTTRRTKIGYRVRFRALQLFKGKRDIFNSISNPYKLLYYTQFLNPYKLLCMLWSPVEQIPRSKQWVRAEEDFVAAEVEDAMESMRNEVIEQIQPDHSLTYDGYDLGDLVARKRLSKLTVPVLQDI